jgi:hypothetical protein
MRRIVLPLATLAPLGNLTVFAPAAEAQGWQPPPTTYVAPRPAAPRAPAARMARPVRRVTAPAVVRLPRAGGYLPDAGVVPPVLGSGILLMALGRLLARRARA